MSTRKPDQGRPPRPEPPATLRTDRFRYVREGLLALLILTGGFCAAGVFRPLCRFKSEVVTLTVVDDRLHVNGLYRYEHDWPVTIVQGFSCPFPSGDGLEGATDFTAELVSSDPNAESTLLPVNWLNGTPYFQARIPAGRVTEVRIQYVQKMGATGKYFLTTTQPWQQPLEHGRYVLNLNERKLVSCNYPSQKIQPGRYEFERTDFLPERDWIFTLEPAEHPQ